MAHDVLLKMEGISKAFPGVKALDNVNLEVKSGTVHALMGENGAGKSTLLNILTGITKAHSGQADFNGINLLKLSSYKLRRHNIARTFQTPRLFPSLSVEENFALVGKTPPLFKNPNLLATQLDYAQSRRVELFRALELNPKLLFLDELSAGMVHEGAKELLEEVIKHSLTAVMVEHNLSLVREFCEYTLALDCGQTIAFGKTQSVLSDKTVMRKLMGE